MTYTKNLMLIMLLSVSCLGTIIPETIEVERDAFFFVPSTTSSTAEPSTLQYYEFTENLADEITIDVFRNKDLSNFGDKHLFVGYGAVDPTGKDCKIFLPSVTGLPNPITVCLPWWRIERQYLIPTEQEDGSFLTFLSRMQRPRPPKNVDICNSWEASTQLPSGVVTCTSYYDKTKSASCYENPVQPECFTQNCGSWVNENCTRLGRSLAHEREYLEGVELNLSAPNRLTTKVNLVTEQWECPGGSFTNFAQCLDEETVMMFPYECKPDNPETPLDDSIMKYCDTEQPIRNAGTGVIEGFIGTCPGEAADNGIPFEVTCRVDGFIHNELTCQEYGEPSVILNDEIFEESYDLNYIEQRVRVLSGSIDRFAAREDCIRANTIEDSQTDVVYMNVEGSGSLDDDIYIIVHSSDDNHNVVYCNQQHNENQGSVLNFPELGGATTCVNNNGNYSYSQQVNVNTADIMSIQQATENENNGALPFSEYSNYKATSVIIDGIEAAPETFSNNFPYCSGHLDSESISIWENTLGSLTLLFPYSGAYTIFFFTDDGRLVARREIGEETFATIGSAGYQQLFLANDIPIAPSLDANNEETLCLNDNWTEYGGGVNGGRGSVSGDICQSPDTGSTYQQNNAIKRVVVKNQLTGAYTIIPLVYPLGYPNRVFISKVKLYEDRVYHCYENPAIKAPF